MNSMPISFCGVTEWARSLPRGAAPLAILRLPGNCCRTRLPLGGQLSGCRPPQRQSLSVRRMGYTRPIAKRDRFPVRTPRPKKGDLGLVRRSATQVGSGRRSDDDADGAKERTAHPPRRGWRRGCSLPDQRSCQCRREYLHYRSELSTWRPHADQCQQPGG